MSQMTKQGKTPEKELNKMETSTLLGAELKTLIIRMLNKFSKNHKRIKKDQLDMMDTLSEMNNNLQGIRGAGRKRQRARN